VGGHKGCTEKKIENMSDQYKKGGGGGSRTESGPLVLGGTSSRTGEGVVKHGLYSIREKKATVGAMIERAGYPAMEGRGES